MAISRTVKWIFGFVVTFVALLMTVIVLFAALVSAPSEDEVVRVASPDGKLDAILVETNGGATASFGYEVYVVESAGKPDGSPAAFMYEAVRNKHAYGANLRWEKPNLVAIEFLNAKWSELKTSTVLVGDQEIFLEMRSGILDASAAPGGMLYNLQGRE